MKGDKMWDRFRVMHVNAAIEAGYLDKWHNRHDDFFYVLMDFQDPENPKLVATDCGQPEDNSFVRDYAWIAPLLNALNNEMSETCQNCGCHLLGD